MKKIFKKIISVFLSATMIITVSPVTTLAMEDVENNHEISTENISIEQEIESKRTENSKTYLTKDGGYYQISAAIPIHKAVNDKWIDISKVSKNVETVADAQSVVSELAEYADLNSNSENGFYETETLTMCTNGPEQPFKIAGRAYNNGVRSCVYVEPNIITDKSVFINKATLTVETGDVITDDNTNYIQVFRLASKLTTPGNRPLKYDEKIKYDKQMATQGDSCDLDITLYARYCSLGVYENNGLALEPFNTDKTSIDVKSIVLGIYYREIGDVDKNIESETVDLGRAGQLYINDYTCSPLIVRNDLGIYDELAEVNIQTIINTVAIDENLSDGVNTRTNYYSTLQYLSGEYYWKNCEGDNVYFVKNTDTKYVGMDSAGNNYLLKCFYTSDDYDYITIEYSKDDNNSIIYHFKSIGSKGYLTKIEYLFVGEDGTQYRNEINISYSETNISYITDGSGRKYKYNYENGMLSSINVYYYKNATEYPVKINNEKIAILYTYDKNNRLNKITYPDGYYIIYSYDDNGRIIEIKSYDNNTVGTKELKKLNLEYENGSSNILKKYKLNNNNKTTDEVEINSIVGNVYNRIFKNKTNNTEKIMHYNADSNLIHYKDYNDQEYYLNYSNGELETLIYAESEENSIIKNGSFDNENNWSLSEASSITNNAPVKEDGNMANKVLAFAAEKYTTGTTQTVAVTPGKSYVLSCSAYCTQTYPFRYDDNNKRYFSVQVAGGSRTIVGETTFDSNIVGNWQTSKVIIKIPSTMCSVNITVNSYDMPGACYFDDLSMYLVNDENTSDVSSSKDIQDDEILRNKYGQITDVIHNRVGNNTLGKYYEYDDAHYKSLVDDEGKTTYYNYDCGNGLLMSKGKNSDSDKNTQYVYSGIGALTAVNQALTNITGETINQNVEYTYDDDKLASIYHNGSLYEYTYNEKGLIENISVKETQEEDSNTDFSISYEYNKNNVGKIIFGNGSSITYTYNKNNITQTIYDNGKTGDENKTYIYSYEYSDNGTIKKMTDEVSNTVTTYSKNGSTVTKDGKTIYSDNGKKMNLFGNSFSYSHSESKKNNITTITENSSASLTGPNVDSEVVLDGFNRITNSKITNKASLDINTHYRMTNQTEYLSKTDLKESSLVMHYKTSVEKRKNRFTEKYDNMRLSDEWYYEYDDVGRITKVFKKSISNITYAPENATSYPSDKGELVRYYKYDEGGQLILEANTETKKAISYLYDAGGNIARKTTYSSLAYNYNYNTGEFTFNPNYGGSVKTFSYKSSGMTDYLTEFNGTEIKYDESGNPTTYAATSYTAIMRDVTSSTISVSGEMVWNGNLLTTFIDSTGGRYEYTYDGDGHRTSKIYYEKKEYTIPKSIIEYIWEGDTLVGYRTRYYGYEANSDKELIPENYVLNWDKTIKLIYSDGDLIGASVVAGKNSGTNTELSSYFDWEQSGNYSFMRDGQGNITKIYDSNEQVVVSISYDAYGNMTQDYTGEFVKKLADQKPTSGSDFWQGLSKAILTAIVSVYTNGMFLSVEQGFDGYIYDKETGLYYGQQRYYCPSWGRFLNASDPMTLTEDMSSIYNANLFNYCGNDPINNVSRTGFNTPCTVISDAILPQLTTDINGLIKEDRSTAKAVGEISTAFDILGLGLKTTKNKNAQNYWNEVLDKKSDIVDNGYGLSYIQSAIKKNTSSITKYSVNNTNTPYKATESIE